VFSAHPKDKALGIGTQKKIKFAYRPGPALRGLFESAENFIGRFPRVLTDDGACSRESYGLAQIPKQKVNISQKDLPIKKLYLIAALMHGFNTVKINVYSPNHRPNLKRK